MTPELLLKFCLALSVAVFLLPGCASQTKTAKPNSASVAESKLLGYGNYRLGMTLEAFYDERLPKPVEATALPKLIQSTDPNIPGVVCYFSNAKFPPFFEGPYFLFFKLSDDSDSTLCGITGKVKLTRIESAVDMVSRTFGSPTIERPLNSLGKAHYEWRKNGCAVSLNGDDAQSSTAELVYVLESTRDDLQRLRKTALEKFEEREEEPQRKLRERAGAAGESESERARDLEDMNDGLVPDDCSETPADVQLPLPAR